MTKAQKDLEGILKDLSLIKTRLEIISSRNNKKSINSGNLNFPLENQFDLSLEIQTGILSSNISVMSNVVIECIEREKLKDV